MKEVGEWSAYAWTDFQDFWWSYETIFRSRKKKQNDTRNCSCSTCQEIWVRKKMRAILVEHTFSTFDRQKLFIVLTFLFPFVAVFFFYAYIKVESSARKGGRELDRQNMASQLASTLRVLYRKKKQGESKMYKHKFCNNMRERERESMLSLQKHNDERIFPIFFPHPSEHEDIIFDKIWDSLAVRFLTLSLFFPFFSCLPVERGKFIRNIGRA